MNNKGKLIVIDGLDGCGKTTQLKLVHSLLKAGDKKVLMISYPDYKNKSSALVKLYLNGNLAKNPQDINAYAASSFYAVDRFASFKQFWESYYNDGYTIIAGRYVSSNAIHQMIKLPQSEWDSYLKWLDDYEYNKLCLPRPDKIIFLNLPTKIATELIEQRYHGNKSKKDIHEMDIEYQSMCQISASYAAKTQGWCVIECAEDDEILPIVAITKQIMNAINCK